MSAVKRGLPLMLEATFSEVYEASLQIPGFGQGQTKEAGLTPDWETDDGQHVKVNFWVHQHDEPVRDYVYERYGLAAKCVFGAKVAMKQPIEAWPPKHTLPVGIF